MIRLGPGDPCAPAQELYSVLKMNPLRVVCYCTYPGRSFPKEKSCAQIEAAYLLILAVKGAKELYWSRDIPAVGKAKGWVLGPESREGVFGWFAQVAAPELEKADSALVPIPGCSHTTADQVRSGSGFRLAQALGRASGLEVLPCLFWDRPLVGTKDGGPRGAQELFTHLRLGDIPDRVGSVVLVDDVFTKGGHVRACEAALRIHAGLAVDLALCAAKTVEKPQGPAFARRVVSIARYDLTSSVSSVSGRALGARGS